MQLNKIRLSKDASERLKHLKARTGLTPNILSRLGFCLSLSDPAIPNVESYPEEDREFNRYTLLGEWDDLFVALLRQRMAQDNLPEEQLEAQFRAHLNRGVLSLFGLVKSMWMLPQPSTHRAPCGVLSLFGLVKSMSDLAVLCERAISRNGQFARMHVGESKEYKQEGKANGFQRHCKRGQR